MFVTFLYGVLGQGWYLIVSIPDLCTLWVAMGPTFIQAEDKDYSQTMWMRRLTLISFVRTCQLVPYARDCLISLSVQARYSKD